MLMEANSIFETGIAVLVTAISAFCLFMVLKAQKRLTPGLVKQLTSGIVFVAANLCIYSVWLLLILSNTIVLDSKLLEALPAIVVIILFTIVAVYTNKMAKTYGFRK